MKKLVLILTVVSVAGCATWENSSTKTKGTATGALVGAVAGAAISTLAGADTEETLLAVGAGAAVGAVAGRQIGKRLDRQKAEMEALLDEQDRLVKVGEEQSAQLQVALAGDVLFAFGKADVQPGAVDKVRRLAGVLNRYPDSDIHITGHTDDVGTEESNLGLSLRRAKSVYDILIGSGVSRRRMTFDGAGESRPVVPNTSDANRAQNRRVEITITPTMPRR